MNRSLSLQKTDVIVLLAVQLAIVVLSAGGFLLAQGSGAAQAAVYGGAVATLMLGRRVFSPSGIARSHPGQETTMRYFGAVQRFVAVLVLFALGIGWIGLQPVPLLVGFGAAQLGYFVNGALLMHEVNAAEHNKALEKLAATL